MSLLLKILKGLGLVILAIVLLSAAHVGWRWNSYWSGFLPVLMNFPTAFTDTSHYQPQAPVAGAQSTLPRRPDDRLSAAVDAARAGDDGKTVSVLVWHDGAIIQEWYGEGFDADSRTATASMNKSVTAIMLGAAIADGHIAGIDERAGDHVPAWRDREIGAASLEHLLQMRSGIETYSQFWPPSSPLAQAYLGRDGVAPLARAELADTPGEVFSYSGLNSQALVIAIAEATGRPYTDYLSERLWRRIGASDAAMWVDRNNVPRGFCCLYARPDDWLRLGILIKDQGRWNGEPVIPAEWVDAMLTPSPANPNYGYHIWLGTEYQPERYLNSGVSEGPLSEPYAAPDLAYFDGAGGQRVFISRGLDLVVVRTGDFAIEFDDSVFINTIIRGLPEAALDPSPIPN